MKIVELKWGEIIAEDQDSADNDSNGSQKDEETDENGGEEE
jgi:hypothetical protein